MRQGQKSENVSLSAERDSYLLIVRDGRLN